ncbi:MAG: hypothetical protein HC933_16100 [Pleurocapsa sp. SU_196_0]|nr:hypothetical protein [Pleurocapsa sp. SU_196_0]
MNPASYDLMFYRYDTPDTSFRLRGDRTTHVAKFQIRNGVDGPILADLSSGVTAILEPAVGDVPVKTRFKFRGFTPEEFTAIRNAITPRYDFQLVSGTITKTYYRGRVRVKADISRDA